MKILLPIDGSELSLHEVRFAIHLVREGLQAEFLLANAQEPASLYEMVVLADPQALDRISHAAGEHVLEAAQALLVEAGIPFETVVVTGDPAHTMVDVITEYGCELVIMGSQGTGALLGVLQGSVSRSLQHDSPVPVLLVKPPVTDVEPQDIADVAEASD